MLIVCEKRNNLFIKLGHMKIAMSQEKKIVRVNIRLGKCYILLLTFGSFLKLLEFQKIVRNDRLQSVQLNIALSFRKNQ